MNEPIWDVAHLAHVEMLTPELDESTRFFTDIMGMSISDVAGDSVYLRAYDDYEHHTLKLTASPQPGMRHFAWPSSTQRVSLPYNSDWLYSMVSYRSVNRA